MRRRRKLTGKANSYWLRHPRRAGREGRARGSAPGPGQEALPLGTPAKASLCNPSVWLGGGAGALFAATASPHGDAVAASHAPAPSPSQVKGSKGQRPLVGIRGRSPRPFRTPDKARVAQPKAPPLQVSGISLRSVEAHFPSVPLPLITKLGVRVDGPFFLGVGLLLEDPGLQRVISDRRVERFLAHAGQGGELPARHSGSPPAAKAQRSWLANSAVMNGSYCVGRQERATMAAVSATGPAGSRGRRSAACRCPPAPSSPAAVSFGKAAQCVQVRREELLDRHLGIRLAEAALGPCAGRRIARRRGRAPGGGEAGDD